MEGERVGPKLKGLSCRQDTKEGKGGGAQESLFLRQFRRRLLLSSSCAVRLVSLAPFFPTCHSRLRVGGKRRQRRPPLLLSTSFLPFPSLPSQVVTARIILSFLSSHSLPSLSRVCAVERITVGGKKVLSGPFFGEGKLPGKLSRR